ncbi:MAG TPA: YSC84-related protein [Steroidobacteraceae bacterium]|nr:YSC84-related protein [Steroidobacteraceae bacterium]
MSPSGRRSTRTRSHGIFAGLALDGTVITIDDAANAAFYKKPGVTAGDILAGNVTTDDESARRFMAAVATSTTGATSQRTASAAGPVVPATAVGGPVPAAVTAQPPAGHTAGAAAQSFPLADPKPGQEPK